MNYHVPVLLQETMEGLDVSEGKRFIDATLGGAGHTKRMVELGAEVLAIDTDPEALEEATTTQNKGFRVYGGNFRDIEAIAKSQAWYPVDGVLFDLGVSSHQLDSEERGFSYKFADAPFDLRLNQEEGVSAAEIINRENEEQLKTIIGTYGEEESCGCIAHALVRSRVKRPIRTTGDVLRIIQEATGDTNNHKTASRVFQAFRIHVNDELNNLKKGLEGAVNVVKPGGRIAVISFHSLEDRIVKQFFQKSELIPVSKKPVRPTKAEQQKNKKSRSAKLRIARKI